jgi:histidinol-phosphate/aromatic aminotransferase/cobyric acid decarboxylase-like protein
MGRDGATVSAVPPPGAHGGDGDAVAAALGLDRGQVLDLSVSLNPVAPDLTSVFGRHLGALRGYPDPSIGTRALADTLGVDEQQVLLTNGGAEAIHLVAEVLGGRVCEPEFSLHPRGDGPLWRSNPHSPSGLLARPDDQAEVWDEAFYPLATGEWTRGDDAVVVGSLTKLFAAPGLRLGYIVVPLDRLPLLERCRACQPAWAVNSLALAALPELVAAADLPGWARDIRVLRHRLVDMLRRHGLAPLPSDATWVLVDAPGLRERLAPAGVVVRDCSNFGLPGIVRIAVPSVNGIDRLDDALRSVSSVPDAAPRSAASTTPHAGNVKVAKGERS